MSDNIEIIESMIDQASDEVKAIWQTIKVLKEENEKLRKEIANLQWRLHEQD